MLILHREDYCDMKIKEKGLTGKAADLRRDTISSRKGFNAFKEMENPSKQNSSGRSKEKPEVFLEFMGTKIRVYDDDEEEAGYVKTEDVPFFKGATLKFTGCGGDANFTEMKVTWC
jgi:lupus La protein